MGTHAITKVPHVTECHGESTAFGRHVIKHLLFGATMRIHLQNQASSMAIVPLLTWVEKRAPSPPLEDVNHDVEGGEKEEGETARHQYVGKRPEIECKT